MSLFRRYGLYGVTIQEFLTYQGRVLWHEDKAELAYLFPIAKNGEVAVRELPADFPADQCLPIRHHPEMSWVRWPLTKEQFRRS
jgi:hypothetical protein